MRSAATSAQCASATVRAASRELAVLVVRKSDRLPGEGFFHNLWREGAYNGPATGPAAQASIRRETERVFAHWAERRA
jgi:hypothetical protein